MKPKRKTMQKDILFIFISSFIVVVAWISFNIYHIWATSTVSQDVQVELTPIIPVFDPVTIAHLKTRENIEPLFAFQKSAAKSLGSGGQSGTTPSPTPLASGIPSTSSQDETVASATSQLTPLNSTINRVGQ